MVISSQASSSISAKPAREPWVRRACGAQAANRATRGAGDEAEFARVLVALGTAVTKSLPAGASLIGPDGSECQQFYVESGGLELFLPDDPAHHAVASFGRGAWFTFDGGSAGIASCIASRASVVVSAPVDAIEALADRDPGVRSMVLRCHAFDLRAFLDGCYPARERFRLVDAKATAGREWSSAPHSRAAG